MYFYCLVSTVVCIPLNTVRLFTLGPNGASNGEGSSAPFPDASQLSANPVDVLIDRLRSSVDVLALGYLLRGQSVA